MKTQLSSYPSKIVEFCERQEIKVEAYLKECKMEKIRAIASIVSHIIAALVVGVALANLMIATVQLPLLVATVLVVVESTVLTLALKEIVSRIRSVVSDLEKRDSPIAFHFKKFSTWAGIEI